MEDTYLQESLQPLKEDLKLRPDKAQYLFSLHLAKLNECIEKRYSLIDIFNYLYGENKSTTFFYFKNLLYRARKKNKKLVIQQSTNNRSVFNETVKQTTNQNTIIKNNPLADLSTPKETKQLHSSASDKKSLDDRIARMIAEREGN